MAFPPQKKPGLAVGVVIGKPKGDPSSGGLPPLKRLDQPDDPMDKGGDKSDPGADPMDPGDDPDDQGDIAQVGDYAHAIAAMPDIGPAFASFLKDLHTYCANSGAGAHGSDQPDLGGGNYDMGT